MARAALQRWGTDGPRGRGPRRLGRAVLCLCGLAATAAVAQTPAPPAGPEGLRFECAPDQRGRLRTEVAAWFAAEGIAPGWYRVTERANSLVYTLATPPSDTDTLGLKAQPRYAIADTTVTLPGRRGHERTMKTASRREILLALMQHGRLSSFAGSGCGLDALREQVEIRQNVVAWAKDLSWVWPNGAHARWNDRYWRHGSPRPDVPIHDAVQDAFAHPRRYAIGCYTATRLTLVQAVLDYYRRVRNDPDDLRRVEARLMADGEPLRHIEPGRMWDFEKDFDPGDDELPGKLADIQYGVAPGNFVPGDWVYFLNTDPKSAAETGYEGSNAIYLGGGRFDDYYDDNGHSYTFHEKLDEVYQWRYDFAGRSHEGTRHHPLTDDAFRRLELPPAKGGLVMDLRVLPRGLRNPRPEARGPTSDVSRGLP